MEQPFTLLEKSGSIPVYTRPGTLYYLAIAGEDSESPPGDTVIRATIKSRGTINYDYKIKNILTGTTIDTIIGETGNILCLTFIAPTDELYIENISATQDTLIAINPVIQ